MKLTLRLHSSPPPDDIKDKNLEPQNGPDEQDFLERSNPILDGLHTTNNAPAYFIALEKGFSHDSTLLMPDLREKLEFFQDKYAQQADRFQHLPSFRFLSEVVPKVKQFLDAKDRNFTRVPMTLKESWSKLEVNAGGFWHKTNDSNYEARYVPTSDFTGHLDIFDRFLLASDVLYNLILYTGLSDLVYAFASGEPSHYTQTDIVQGIFVTLRGRNERTLAVGEITPKQRANTIAHFIMDEKRLGSHGQHVFGEGNWNVSKSCGDEQLSYADVKVLLNKLFKYKFQFEKVLWLFKKKGMLENISLASNNNKVTGPAHNFVLRYIRHDWTKDKSAMKTIQDCRDILIPGRIDQDEWESFRDTFAKLVRTYEKTITKYKDHIREDLGISLDKCPLPTSSRDSKRTKKINPAHRTNADSAMEGIENILPTDSSRHSRSQELPDVDLSKTRNKEGHAKVPGRNFPASALDGDSRVAPSTGEVWHADFPPFFTMGDTEYTAMLASNQLTEDLARGMPIICSKSTVFDSNKNTGARELDGEPEPEQPNSPQPSSDDGSIHFSQGSNSRSGSVFSNIKKRFWPTSEEPRVPQTFWDYHIQEWKLPTPNNVFMRDVDTILNNAQRNEPTKLPTLSFKRVLENVYGEDFRKKKRLVAFKV
jgi:hypothetical protein